MEKLIELLNEWELEVWSSRLKWYIWNNPIWIYCKSSDYHFWLFSKIILISKEYWFIKRLVENDKIDRDRILKENWQFRLFYYDLERVKNYDRLVMYLSVEDNPIEFLISILK